MILDPEDAPSPNDSANTTIQHQAAEIERLRRELDTLTPVADFRAALRLAGVTGVIAEPLSPVRLTEMIVVAAADVINAQAASLFLLDQERDELVFEVAIGPNSQEVEKFRLPLGHGLAGLVALTGQPMAIADTATDSRDAADIAEAIGYSPKNILCVPLVYADETIGVLELLDKEGGEAFTATDMETLALFAQQAAVAVQQDRTLDQLDRLVRRALAAFIDAAGNQASIPTGPTVDMLDDVVGDAGFQRSMELGRLVREIARHGDREVAACQAMLEGFAAYLRSQPRLGDIG